jgi:hypothetical protein
MLSIKYLSLSFSLPGKATQSICTDLLGILKEILSYAIGGLFNPLNLFLLCLTGVCQTWPGI